MLKKILAIVAMLYAAVCFAAVDVNKASAAELDSVKGIGPAISTKILDERKKGNFKDWNDFIERVKGVGEVNAAKFSTEGLNVNGAGFKGAVAAPAVPAAKPAAKAEEKKVDAKPAAAAPAAPVAAKEEKKDPKAEAKAKKDAEKIAKAEAKQKKSDEAKAKKETDTKAKDDAKMAKDAKPAAKDTKAEPAKPAASAAKK